MAAPRASIARWCAIKRSLPDSAGFSGIARSEVPAPVCLSTRSRFPGTRPQEMADAIHAEIERLKTRRHQRRGTANDQDPREGGPAPRPWQQRRPCHPSLATYQAHVRRLAGTVQLRGSHRQGHARPTSGASPTKHSSQTTAPSALSKRPRRPSLRHRHKEVHNEALPFALLCSHRPDAPRPLAQVQDWEHIPIPPLARSSIRRNRNELRFPTAW